MALASHEQAQRRRAEQQRRKKSQAILCLVILGALLVGVAFCLIKGVQSLDAQPHAVPVTTTTETPTTTTTAPSHATLPAETVDAQIRSQGVLLYDATHDAVLYRYHASDLDIYYPASLTKLLTASIACQYMPDGATFVVGSEIGLAEWDASMAYIQQGTVLTLSEILDALLMRSGADAAYCIAVNVARYRSGNTALSDTDAVSLFVQYMNEEAAALGCVNSNFVTPDGYHDVYHYTTAEDLLKIVLYADSFPAIHDCVGQAISATGYYNTNSLLDSESEFYRDYAIGMKTGSTDEAGYCLAASAEKNGVRLYAILLGGAENADRYYDAGLLLDLGFELLGGAAG